MADFRAYTDGRLRIDDLARPYITTSSGLPLAGDISVAGNFIHIEADEQHAALNVFYRIDDFGEVMLRTRPLPQRDDPYNLSFEIAHGKLAEIETAVEAWSHGHFTPSRIIREEVDRARTYLQKAAGLEHTDPLRCSKYAEKSLTRLLWAAESIAIEAGRHGIERKIVDGTSKNMLLGANCFGLGTNEMYDTRFAELFNYATLPFYWKNFEPENGQENWAPVRKMLSWLNAQNITAKGHPLIWFYNDCYPQWAHRNSFDELLALNIDRVGRVISACPQITYWDIINEAHDVDHANIFSLSRDQLVETTIAAAQAAREANPKAKTVVNVCAPYGEYASHEKGKWCPLDYLRACIDRGADFDAIGVQFYYGSGWGSCRDLMDVSLQLDRYGSLGKPVHVTEIGCPSSDEPDPNHLLGPLTVRDAGQWHGKWSENLQAEWVEKFYTICCGKPYIEAVTWWDLADTRHHFFTHGGLLRRDYTRKPAFNRLLDLADRLGIRTEPE